MEWMKPGLGPTVPIDEDGRIKVYTDKPTPGLTPAQEIEVLLQQYTSQTQEKIKDLEEENAALRKDVEFWKDHARRIDEGEF